MLDCKCKHLARTSNRLASGVARNEMLEGRKYLVVPVIMAKADVVMNGGLIPEDEMVPHAWNGASVTVDHPHDSDGESVPLFEPGTVARYDVGTIFNARVEAGALKAEAWIDIEKAGAKFPGLIEALRKGEQIDVSTGYFCDTEEVAGTINGRAYTEIHRNLRPEHLALLPGAEGACSWRDGCGVRVNAHGSKSKMNKAMKALARAIDAVMKANETDPDDPRQMVADLISREDTPFGPDDQPGLEAMSLKTLRAVHEQYIVIDPEDVEEEEDDVKEVAKKNGRRPQMVTLSKADFDRIVNCRAAPVLSTEDRAALAEVRKANEARRASMVEAIKANSTFGDAFLKGLSFEQLSELHSGLPRGTAVGRMTPVVQVSDDAPEDVKAMTQYVGDAGIVAFRKQRALAK